MILFKKAAQASEYVAKSKHKGNKIGFVPTMGALHAGHLSLIGQAKIENDISVCSIFVNPTQFNDPADYLKYPKKLSADIALLEEAGNDVLFLPAPVEIYPAGTKDLPAFDLGHLEKIMEGAYRPGHFQGVCQVMSRLLTIIPCGNLYMGQKDYQQCMVVKRLLNLMNVPIAFHACPTKREADGLAMSSRNLRLSEDQRQQAVLIFKTLSFLKDKIATADLTKIKQEARHFLEQNRFKVDYVEIAGAESLEPLNTWDGQKSVVALIAASLGDVRLIDNLNLTE
jgi:pantoate--beta-alanine ligase